MKAGIAAAVDELGAGVAAAGELAPAVQDELFNEIAAEELAAFSQSQPWSGRGRKPGSRNRTTRLVVEYIQKRGRDPLIALASVVSMSPEEVRRHFGFKTGDEAAKFWRACCSDLAPYMHSRMPQAVVMEVGQGFAPIFLDFGAVQRAANEPTTIEAKAEENQAVSFDALEQVAWPQGRMNG